MTYPASEVVWYEQVSERHWSLASTLNIDGTEYNSEDTRRIVNELVATSSLHEIIEDTMVYLYRSLLELYTVPQIDTTNIQCFAIGKVFVNTCIRWGLDENQQSVLLGLGAQDSWSRLIILGRTENLPRDVEDRAGIVVGIGMGLDALYKSQTKAEHSWLRLPRAKFNNKSALEFMLEGSFLNLLVVSEMVKRERGI